MTEVGAVSPGGAAEAHLPAAFTRGEARQRGVTDRRLRALQDQGVIELWARGLYIRSDAPPHEADLMRIAVKAPLATLCLRSALARHGLIDDIPEQVDLALPRGRRHPTTGGPVRWHAFDPGTFEVGRDELALEGGFSLGLYGSERSIVDAFRLRHREGPELANEALKAWLRQRGNPASLLRTALSFPKALPSVRGALEVLL